MGLCSAITCFFVPIDREIVDSWPVFYYTESEPVLTKGTGILAFVPGFFTYFENRRDDP